MVAVTHSPATTVKAGDSVTARTGHRIIAAEIAGRPRNRLSLIVTGATNGSVYNSIERRWRWHT